MNSRHFLTVSLLDKHLCTIFYIQVVALKMMKMAHRMVPVKPVAAEKSMPMMEQDSAVKKGT